MPDAALGFKAHSGWAAMVAVAATGTAVTVLARQRVALVEAAEAHWAMQPYHAAENLPAAAAALVVERSVAMATRLAAAAVKTLLQQLRAQGHTASACGVVLGSGMPDWTVAQVLLVHARMHQAEGELFRTVLVRAGERAGIKVTGVGERELWQHGAKTLRVPVGELQQRITMLGKTVGPPWRRDQKDAALVAWLALRAAARSR